MGGNELKVEGAKIMADLLKTNTTLTSIEYAASYPSPHRQHPTVRVLTVGIEARGGVLKLFERSVDLERLSDVLCTLCVEVVAEEAANED